MSRAIRRAGASKIKRESRDGDAWSVTFRRFLGKADKPATVAVVAIAIHDDGTGRLVNDYTARGDEQTLAQGLLLVGQHLLRKQTADENTGIPSAEAP
jgi:hypothetical protein